MKDHQSFLELIGFDEAPSSPSKTEPLSSSDQAVKKNDDESSEVTPFRELSRSITLARTEITHIDKSHESTQDPELTRTERFAQPEASADLLDSEATVVEHLPEQATARIEESAAWEGFAKDPDVVEQNAPPELVESELVENGTAHFDYTADDQGPGRLVLLEGNANARAFHLNELPLRLGRDAENHAVLNDSNASRFHAEIHHDDQGFRVVDLGSTNGIKVNGQVVAEAHLQAHDILQIGENIFEYLPAGALSKGAPQVQLNSLPDTASAKSVKPSRKKRIIATIVFLACAGGLYVYSQRGEIRQAATAAVTHEIKSGLAEVKTSLEKDSGKTFDALSADEVKAAFMAKLGGLDIVKLVPEAQIEQLKSLPAPIIHVMLDDDTVVERILNSDYTTDAVETILRDKLNELIVQKRYGMALGLAKIFSEAHPENETLKKAVEQLEGVVGEKTGKAQANGETDDEKKFYETMADIEKVYQSFIAKKRSADALKYVRTVQEKLNIVFKMAPFLEKLIRAEMEKWEGRVVQLELQVRDQQAQAEAARAKDNAIEDALREIHLLMSMGEAGKAYTAAQKFLTEHPRSTRADEVKAILTNLDRMLNESFATTKIQVERSLQIQIYEQAWKQLYLFLDIAPHHKSAQELRASLEKATHPRAIQFYNQARVYEYEADDLMAAEQYYKKSFETADPRSDLARKAERRLADVRRKLVR